MTWVTFAFENFILLISQESRISRDGGV